MRRIGFDNDQYIKLQSERIRERIAEFGGKLYLEFGGKLFDDNHAARVLPGFKPDSKVNMLLNLRDQVEIVIVINAGDIESSKQRGDLGITYDMEVLRLIDAFRGIGLYVGSVVIAQYREQSSADNFMRLLDSRGVKVYRHYPIEGYPSNIPAIVCDEGFGRNDFIETERSLVVVTAPGPGSGKMATCLSQLYHEHRRGVQAGYAKFETFPIWNLPIKHPINLAYEAATAELNDINMLDPFHLNAYGVQAVNYNRDVDIFPVLNAIFQKIYGSCRYQSPTDMGVNMVGFCITDDDACCEASRQEIIRRYYSIRCQALQGLVDAETVLKLELLMNKAGCTPECRPVIGSALKVAEETEQPACAMQLPDGTIVTGKNKELLGASAAMLLNALKILGNIPDNIHLLSPDIIQPVQNLKVNHLGNHNPRLHTDEVLIALSISAATNDYARIAMEQLSRLSGCEAHSTVIISSVDETTFRKLGVNITCEPRYQSKKLYHKK
ncbi:MAG: DUF1846 domain-containing protein [Ruminococcaceae bacterium]|nr:DUF1846 domain-containing protein [Oscillospiraceae bacterium]